MLRFPFFRGGIGPSRLLDMNMEKLTGKQKLDLIKCRIFGEMIGGNPNSGLKELKKNLSAVRRQEYYTLQFAKELNPFARPMVRNRRKHYKIFKTMKRNAMRGIKLNKKRLDLRAAIISQFGEVKKTTPSTRAEPAPETKSKPEKATMPPKEKKGDDEGKKKGGKKGKKGEDEE